MEQNLLIYGLTQLDGLITAHIRSLYRKHTELLNQCGWMKMLSQGGAAEQFQQKQSHSWTQLGHTYAGIFNNANFLASGVKKKIPVLHQHLTTHAGHVKRKTNQEEEA